MVIKRGLLLQLMAFLVYIQGAYAVNLPPQPHIEAKAWALVDARSGAVLSAKNENLELPPASLTKMMTLYLAFEDIKLGRLDPKEKVRVSEKAWKMGGSRMFLEPRLTPTVEELLHGIATLSGNDACIALAEHIAGTEENFVQRMNAKAKALGLIHTHFKNSTGYPEEGHVSSALDMAKLGIALWRDFPEQYKLFSEKSYSYNGITQPNRNRLLWSDPRVDGIKTGHTEDAGYCLVSSATQGNMRLVASVFGTKSERAREQQSRALLNYGFRNFVTLRPAAKDLTRVVEVFEGEENEVKLVPEKEVWITVPKGIENKLRFHLRYPSPLRAPIKKGQAIGEIEAVIGEKESQEVLASIPMVAATDVPQASWIGRLWDRIRLWWRANDTLEANP